MCFKVSCLEEPRTRRLKRGMTIVNVKGITVSMTEATLHRNTGRIALCTEKGHVSTDSRRISCAGLRNTSFIFKGTVRSVGRTNPVFGADVFSRGGGIVKCRRGLSRMRTSSMVVYIDRTPGGGLMLAASRLGAARGKLLLASRGYVAARRNIFTTKSIMRKTGAIIRTMRRTGQTTRKVVQCVRERRGR